MKMTNKVLDRNKKHKKKLDINDWICHNYIMNNQKGITPIKQTLASSKKDFNDLAFNDHPNVPDGVQAKLDLPHKLEMSVVSMRSSNTRYGGLYGNASNGTYEVAVFRKDSMLPLGAFDDVLGWQTEADINELMSGLQGGLVEVSNFIDQLYLDRADGRKELELDN